MSSEFDNEEMTEVVETEAADRDDKTQTVSHVSELTPRRNGVSAI